MEKLLECMVSVYPKLPSLGYVVTVLSIGIGCLTFIGSLVGFIFLRKKPWSAYIFFALVVLSVILVCITMDSLILVVGLIVPLIILTDVSLLIETKVRRLGRNAIWVAAGVTIFTVILFFVLAPFGKMVHGMFNSGKCGPVTQSTEAKE